MYYRITVYYKDGSLNGFGSNVEAALKELKDVGQDVEQVQFVSNHDQSRWLSPSQAKAFLTALKP